MTKNKQPVLAKAVASKKTFPILIEGRTFEASFTWGALCAGNNALQRQGIFVNLLLALDFSSISVGMLAPLFWAVIHQQHPEVSYEDAVALVDFDNAQYVENVLFDAYMDAMVSISAKRAKSQNPSKPKKV